MDTAAGRPNFQETSNDRSFRGLLTGPLGGPSVGAGARAACSVNGGPTYAYWIVDRVASMLRDQSEFGRRTRTTLALASDEHGGTRDRYWRNPTMTGKWRDLTDFPNLNQFFETYFDEVWVEIYRDHEEVIGDYLSQAGPEIEAIANEADLLLACATDDELCDTLRWNSVLFLSPHEGVAARTWLSAFRDQLREAHLSADP